MVAQHVHDADGRHGRGEQVRALVGNRAHQQATVAAAGDRQLVASRVTGADEPLGRGDEIVEDILLAQPGAALMPALAELPAPAQIGHGVYATRLEPRGAARGIGRQQRDVEAPIAVQHRRPGLAGRQVPAVNDAHRHRGAVLAGEPHLPRHVLVGGDARLGHTPGFAAATAEVIAVQRPRRGEVRIGEKRLGIGGLAIEARHGAGARQRHFSKLAAVGREYAHLGFHVHDVLHQEPSTDERGIGDGFRGAGRENRPWGRLRLARVDGEHAARGRLVCGLHEKHRALVADELVQAVPAIQQANHAGCRISEIQVVDAAGFVAVGNVDEEVPAIVGYGRIRVARRVVGDAEHRAIGRLVGAERVIPDGHLAAVVILTVAERIPAVVEAAAIRNPGDAGELRAAQHLGQVLARINVPDMPGFPVGAAIGQRVGHPLAGWRQLVVRQRDGAVGA